MRIFRLAVRAVVLLTTGPALLALTACTVSSVAILLTISAHATPGQLGGSVPAVASAPGIATAPAVSPALAGGAAAAIASLPVGSPSPSPADSPVRAHASSPRQSAGLPLVSPADEFGDGIVYYAWITGVRLGTPGKVTMEMAWHYAGQAAQRYAARHHLPPPMDDHINTDRGFAATVTVSPHARISINPDGLGPRLLPASAFLSYAARDLAIRVSGQFAGPLYEVAFHHDILVSAYQVFQP
jgi:hypothetical protein